MHTDTMKALTIFPEQFLLFYTLEDSQWREKLKTMTIMVCSFEEWLNLYHRRVFILTTVTPKIKLNENHLLVQKLL